MADIFIPPLCSKMKKTAHKRGKGVYVYGKFRRVQITTPLGLNLDFIHFKHPLYPTRASERKIR